MNIGVFECMSIFFTCVLYTLSEYRCICTALSLKSPNGNLTVSPYPFVRPSAALLREYQALYNEVPNSNFVYIAVSDTNFVNTKSERDGAICSFFELRGSPAVLER